MFVSLKVVFHVYDGDGPRDDYDDDDFCCYCDDYHFTFSLRRLY